MLNIYNSLTKKIESFTPAKSGTVEMYNCGPTVYDRQQIGNFRTFVFADMLRAVLEYLGYEVKQVMNLTDVGHLTFTDEQKAKAKDDEITDTEAGVDRIEKAAKREGKSVWDVAEEYIQIFMNDFNAFNLKRPMVFPRATEHIPEQIEMIKSLIEKGYAYVTSDAVYFDTSKFKDYNKLAGQELSEKLVAVREEVERDENKRNPQDFRLWQLNQPDHAMQWDSPWGKGFPGWHIECSAMSLKYLSQPIDIHTGGIDHIPVHHTNEIAQAEAATGKKFVNYWMHGAFLRVDGKRMGKSLGNAYNLGDIEQKGFSALDLKYFYYTANYRQTLNFTWEALTAAHQRLEKIYDQARRWRQDSKGKVGKLNDSYKKKLVQIIENDLDMPGVLALISELLKDIKIKPEDALATLLEVDKILRLYIDDNSQVKQLPIAEINELIDQRNQYRKLKDWQKADEVRQLLLSKYSVTLEDKGDKTIWRQE